ncbi:hypothetical protein HNV12_01830 [Methanococcoides sp. SA1]|nr:hypothetical protein [Methanococcoides sp. SA1]
MAKTYKRHDEIVSLLEKRLSHEKRDVIPHFFYKLRGKRREVDLVVLGRKMKYAFLIEVKTTNKHKTKSHARKQLAHTEEYLNKNFKIEKILKFYAYSNEDSYEVMWIK